MTDFFEPLSDAELKRVQRFLIERVDEDVVTDGMDEGVLDVSELDGLFTAVVSGPVTIMPSRWLPAVWGDFEPTWESLEDYEAFVSILMRQMNGIAAMLMEEPEAFAPMYLERIWKGKTTVVVDEWCEGYMRGVGLAAEEWRAGGQEVESLLAPIRAFTEESDWQAHDIADHEQVEDLRDSIAPNVQAIHAYWLARRERTPGPTTPIRGATRQIGRNDPCPCGSGKKYKKCCLQ